jgi:hypothetical protein
MEVMCFLTLWRRVMASTWRGNRFAVPPTVSLDGGDQEGTQGLAATAQYVLGSAHQTLRKHFLAASVDAND